MAERRVMPIMFNSILEKFGVTPSDVILLRHADGKWPKTPYELWAANREDFECYQSYQDFGQNFITRTKMCAPLWATFVATPSGETMFTGLYQAEYRGVLKKTTPWLFDVMMERGSCDEYHLRTDERFKFPRRKIVHRLGRRIQSLDTAR